MTVKPRSPSSPGQVSRQVGAREVKQRAGFPELLCLYCFEHDIAQPYRIAPGHDHMVEAGALRGGRGMPAHRKQRQLQQPAAREMRLNAAQRIGAGDDHRGVVRVGVIVEGDRLKPQHRRLHHLETPGAQTGGGGLVVG